MSDLKCWMCNGLGAVRGDAAKYVVSDLKVWLPFESEGRRPPAVLGCEHFTIAGGWLKPGTVHSWCGCELRPIPQNVGSGASGAFL